MNTNNATHGALSTAVGSGGTLQAGGELSVTRADARPVDTSDARPVDTSGADARPVGRAAARPPEASNDEA
eukprot:CAMPEP_0180439054 /NCGR_PEP_ID=MMETSP1036_2-20121128/12388_1 /TAXON_ID=632150 /ORGANISM="Azadinium spinosum, Strain 3D9" /LENGTH=70 /DNA_ID=CAMNT_0022445177 /DNA_START=140 /DNA_END=352 /DNA_ORIENTATION=-